MAQGSLIPYGAGGDPFLTLRREMDQLFDHMLQGFGMPMATTPAAGEAGRITAPRMDVSESDSEFRITADLPGVAPADVSVTLDDDVLTIRGEKKAQREDERQNYHVIERSYGAFQRSLRLPFSAEAGKVQANFEHGVLTVSVPKSAQQQRSQRIEVRSGSTGGETTVQPGEKSAGRDRHH
ncbi:MAG TPA: Hsp20/alpha crystallin family protein [Burkholderiaceae bacterium]|nr:Hsp20/alpha crystallin family protein [Burkholderiaceae bacterium]